MSFNWNELQSESGTATKRRYDAPLNRDDYDSLAKEINAWRHIELPEIAAVLRRATEVVEWHDPEDETARKDRAIRRLPLIVEDASDGRSRTVRLRRRARIIQTVLSEADDRERANRVKQSIRYLNTLITAFEGIERAATELDIDLMNTAAHTALGNNVETAKDALFGDGAGGLHDELKPAEFIPRPETFRQTA